MALPNWYAPKQITTKFTGQTTQSIQPDQRKWKKINQIEWL